MYVSTSRYTARLLLGVPVRGARLSCQTLCALNDRVNRNVTSIFMR